MTEAELHQKVDQLIQRAEESVTVEFKRDFANPSTIGEYISALANSAALEGHARAWMLWGIADSTREVVGTQFDPSSEKFGNQSLVMWLQQATSPRADFCFHECVYSGRKVVLLEIHPARSAPIAFQGTRFIRIDSHKTKLTEHSDKEARLWAKFGHPDDWSGAIVGEASLGDLDSDALEQARVRFTEYLIKNESDPARQNSIRVEARDWSTATLLDKARITKGGAITRSALLLLGKDESAFRLSPADAKISWILRSSSGEHIASQHFGPPFLLSTERVFAKIRNVVVEHLPDGTLFPNAVQQYDPWVIREALHNAVAHQDYHLTGKINVTEYPDRLVFFNLGHFIPPSIEWMLVNQSPPAHYRNQWLIDGMIRLRMIDQVGSGIRRMFEEQRRRLFPLPDYVLKTAQSGMPSVEVAIGGQILDLKYARMLMTRTDLDLGEILLLDKVQKGVQLPKDDVSRLKRRGLVEGRYPRILVSAGVAAATGSQAQRIKRSGFDAQYYRDLLLKLIRDHGPIEPKVIRDLLMDKLPDSLDREQKRVRIRNLTYDLAHRKGLIDNVGGRGEAARWQLKDAGQAKRVRQ
jgi:ATP-dependent DNA helicase RecG